MKATTAYPTNLRQEISVWWIDFHQTSFSNSGLQEVLDLIETPDEIENNKVFESNTMNVSHLGLSDFLISFSSAEERKDYMRGLCKLPMKHGEYQFPELRGYFDHQGKCYLLTGALNDYEDNSLENNFWYGNIIFDTQAYIQVNGTIQDVVADANIILDWKA